MKLVLSPIRESWQMQSPSISIPPPRSILVITYGGIGDILLTTPLITSLKQAYPEAKLDLYLQEGREGILEGNPDIDSIYTTRARRGVRSYTDFAIRFARRYDLALSARKADRQVLFARIAGRKAISLLPGSCARFSWKRLLLTGSATGGDNEHEVFQMLRLAELLGIPKTYACTAPVSPESEARITALLPFSWKEQPFAVLHAAPRNRYKEWTAAGWARVAKWLADHGIRAVILGGPSPGERDYVETLLPEMPPDTVNLTGRTSFSDAAVLLRTARFYIGLDTSMTHLNAALGRPTIALFGSHDSRVYFPYHESLIEEVETRLSEASLRVGHVYFAHGHCSCGYREEACARQPGEPAPCMQRICPETVIDLLNRIASAR